MNCDEKKDENKQKVAEIFKEIVVIFFHYNFRLSLITRQVREVKNMEEEIRQMKRKLENFDRYASLNNVSQSTGNKSFRNWKLGRVGLVVGVLTFNSNEPSSNPDVVI